MTGIGRPSVTCIYENQGKKKCPEQNAKLRWTGEISKVLNINKLTIFLLEVRETAIKENEI
jgi:hypothetical protein